MKNFDAKFNKNKTGGDNVGRCLHTRFRYLAKKA